MDFELSDRQRHWRDRVRDFIDRHVAPRMDDYHAEQASGDRQGQEQTEPPRLLRGGQVRESVQG